MDAEAKNVFKWHFCKTIVELKLYFSKMLKFSFVQIIAHKNHRSWRLHKSFRNCLKEVFESSVLSCVIRVTKHTPNCEQLSSKEIGVISD